MTSRLPSTRESRPALIGLAIVLIVGGALASAWIALQSGHRAYFVRVDKQVAQGALITADDLGKVSLPEGFSGGVSASEVDSVVGKSAATWLLPGTILTPAMLSDHGGVGDHKTQLTLTVDSSPFINNLRPGAQLALDVGSTDGTTRQAVLAELISVGRASSGGLTDTGSAAVPIVVSVDVSCLSTVSQGIEDKSITPALVGGASGGSVEATCRG